MKIKVNNAVLIKRYKRFLADISLPSGAETTIHVANTGAMTGCASVNDQVWYSTSDNIKRKYPFSWEASLTQDNHWICVNTIRANQLVEEAINNNMISELNGYRELKREISYGLENSKIDFFLQDHNQPDTYVEVKSVTLLDDDHLNKQLNQFNPKGISEDTGYTGRGYFPDAKTLRGQKHLRELSALAKQGKRAVLLFTVLHSGINSVQPATHIDAEYSKLLKQAKKDGVEIFAYKADFTLTNNLLTITLAKKVDVIL